MDYSFPEPPDLSEVIKAHIREIAIDWWKHAQRPKIEKNTLKDWAELLDDWANDPTLPLYVRKQSLGRGTRVLHIKSGKTLVPSDNSPAWWSYGIALSKRVLDLEEIKSLIDGDKIPVALTFKTKERSEAHYKCKLVNRSTGWKVCHIDPIGLHIRDVQNTDIDTIIKHFKNFMNPNNMFLLPKALGPLGEQEAFLGAVKNQISEEKELREHLT